MRNLPKEILQQIIQYSDTLVRVTLSFPIDKRKLLEEGGPGKVLDDFLRRGGNLKFLKKWIPGECVIMHGVLTKDPKKILEIDRIWNTNMFSNQGYELSVITKFVWGVDYIKHDREYPYMSIQEYYAFRRQWDKIEKSIRAYLSYSKFLLDASKEYLAEEAKATISLYKGEEVKIKSYGINRSYMDMKLDIYQSYMEQGLWKQAVDVASLKSKYLIEELYMARSMEGRRHMGVLSEKELRI